MSDLSLDDVFYDKDLDDEDDEDDEDSFLDESQNLMKLNILVNNIRHRLEKLENIYDESLFYKKETFSENIISYKYNHLDAKIGNNKLSLDLDCNLILNFAKDGSVKIVFDRGDTF